MYLLTRPLPEALAGRKMTQSTRLPERLGRGRPQHLLAAELRVQFRSLTLTQRLSGSPDFQNNIMNRKQRPAPDGKEEVHNRGHCICVLPGERKLECLALTGFFMYFTCKPNQTTGQIPEHYHLQFREGEESPGVTQQQDQLGR